MRTTDMYRADSNRQWLTYDVGGRGKDIGHKEDDSYRAPKLWTQGPANQNCVYVKGSVCTADHSVNSIHN